MEIKKRNSSIELTKILAIVLIIISHAASSAGLKSNQYLGYMQYAINMEKATNDLIVLILIIFRYFGAIGDVIFIVCTTYFLGDKNYVQWKKIINWLADSWFISVIILVLVKFFWRGIQPTYDLILKSFFPNLFINNWFISCYIIIYMIHGWLNIIIDHISQKEHLFMNILFSIMYFGFATIDKDLFFYTHLVMFITFYFVVSYMKRYLPVFSKNKRINIILLVFSFLGLIISIFILNVLGLNISFLNSKMLTFTKVGNPFIVIFGISIFNLANMKSFYSDTINYLSGLSLYIYLAHDNLLIKRIIRPIIWEKLVVCFGQDHLILLTLFFAFLLLFASLMFSIIYKQLLQKKICALANYIYQKLNIAVNTILNKLVKIN